MGTRTLLMVASALSLICACSCKELQIKDNSGIFEYMSLRDHALFLTIQCKEALGARPELMNKLDLEYTMARAAADAWVERIKSDVATKEVIDYDIRASRGDPSRPALIEYIRYAEKAKDPDKVHAMGTAEASVAIEIALLIIKAVGEAWRVISEIYRQDYDEALERFKRDMDRNKLPPLDRLPGIETLKGE
jgi:hypothetical protein